MCLLCGPISNYISRKFGFRVALSMGGLMVSDLKAMTKKKKKTLRYGVHCAWAMYGRYLP